MEQVSLYVDLKARRATPYPAAAQDRMAAMQRAHDGLARPAQIGSVMGLRRR